MSSIARFSSWKVNPPTLRTMLAISWLAASDSGWPSDHADSPAALFSTSEEAVGIKSQRTGTEVAAASAARRPSPAACRRSVGSSQLIDGWPSLK